MARVPLIAAVLAVLAFVPGSSAPVGAAVEAGAIAIGEPLLSAEDVKTGRVAMALAKGRQYARAIETARRVADPLLVKILKWFEMVESGGRGNFAEVSAFIADNPEWPGQTALQQRAEVSLPADLPYQAVIDWFESKPPVAIGGAIRLAEALLEAGETERAAAFLRTTWVQRDFPSADETPFRRRFKQQLRHEDDVARLDRLLWDRQISAAKRQAKRLGGGYLALAEARLALGAMRGGVDGAIQRVPAELADNPGLVYERARWRQRKGRYDGVLELLDPPNPDAPRPELWWPLRHWTVRQALVKGDISAAYRIAASHGLESGVDFAEAEWLAGWIALRFLDSPKQAYGHFTRLHTAVNTPISRARAAYWSGEAAVALSERDSTVEWGILAGSWYTGAAQFGTTFYGQLAARQLGTAPAVDLSRPTGPSADDRATFADRDLIRAIRILGELGERHLQENFLRRLTAVSRSETDYVLTAELAQQESRPDLAVKAAKAAAADGYLLIKYLYPSPALPQGETPEQALVLAVVRQESAFYTDAVSGAGAQGLMQIMPRTAKGLARDMNMRFSKKKLRTDPEYNMLLGRAYLSNLTQRYDGSYILALAAYNAGPSRANSWIRAFGDPRLPDVDPIDWIESIPFDETRNYVQRILEGLMVYRQQLGVDGTASIDPFGHRRAPPLPRVQRTEDAVPVCCL